MMENAFEEYLEELAYTHSKYPERLFGENVTLRNLLANAFDAGWQMRADLEK